MSTKECAQCGEKLTQFQYGQRIYDKKSGKLTEVLCNNCAHLGCDGYPNCEEGQCEQEYYIWLDYSKLPNGICGEPVR